MIRPVSDLRNNFAEISRAVHETEKPVILTKNGYADMVVLSMEAFEKLHFESEIYFKLQEAEKEAKLIIEAAQLQKRLIIEAANADASVFVNEKVNYLKERVAKFNEILDTFSAKQQIIDSGFEQARRHLSGINAMMDQMVKNG